MKKILKMLLLVSMFVSIASAKDININELVKDAKEQNKHLMFFFHIPQCPYCENMLKENFKDENTLQEIKKSFLFVDIYTKDKGLVSFNDFKGTRKEFAKHMRVFSYPTTQFLDRDLIVVHEARGYRNIDEFLSEIKYVSTNSYLKMNLETFLEELEFSKDD